jgi:hypothetical protein
MRIPANNKPPELSVLLDALNARFSNRYACKMFEFGEPSIIVKKSFWIGAQITVRNREIELDFTYPNLISGIMGAVLTYIAAFSGITRSWYKLEKELGAFLVQKYA